MPHAMHYAKCMHPECVQCPCQEQSSRAASAAPLSAQEDRRQAEDRSRRVSLLIRNTYSTEDSAPPRTSVALGQRRGAAGRRPHFALRAATREWERSGMGASGMGRWERAEGQRGNGTFEAHLVTREEVRGERLPRGRLEQRGPLAVRHVLAAQPPHAVRVHELAHCNRICSMRIFTSNAGTTS